MSLETFKISLSYSQILDLVKQLHQKDKVKLSRELAREVKDKRTSNKFRFKPPMGKIVFNSEILFVSLLCSMVFCILA